MSVKITLPQAELLRQLRGAGADGVFKSQKYGPAEQLVSFGFAKWDQKYISGTGKLIITKRGENFGC